MVLVDTVGSCEQEVVEVTEYDKPADIDLLVIEGNSDLAFRVCERWLWTCQSTWLSTD